MRYTRVRLAALAHVLPPHVVTSDDLEARLAPVYDRLGLPEGRLELMTGIRERRFFDPGTKPGTISAVAANRALDASGLDRGDIGALLHGSVCRDRLEPATACAVHAACGLSSGASRDGAGGVVYDVSNACLGLLNGVVQVADLIELGRLRAGVVVGTETGRDLVEGTVESLLADPHVTRQDVKRAFASLTIGSGSSALVLCDADLKPHAPRLLGGAVRADTTYAALCTGGDELDAAGRPRMATDSEALLHAGVGLARRTWDDFLSALDLRADGVAKVVTHQVGRAHRKLLLDELGIPLERDYPTVQTLGNTGAAALPTAASLAADAGHFAPGETVAWLGIGSGLNSVMLGWAW